MSPKTNPKNVYSFCLIAPERTVKIRNTSLNQPKYVIRSRKPMVAEY